MRIAVTGSTGRIGGRVCQLLTEAGQPDVVGLSSRNAPYDDPAALRAALAGVDTLVFVSSDGEAARIVVHHRNVIDAAVHCGVRHVVLLSGLDVDPASPFCYAFTNGDTERMLRASGCPYSVVRAGLFTEFFVGLIHQVAVDGVVAIPAGDAEVSLVSREEVARSLADLALRAPTNRHHDVTGPECRPVRDVVADAGYSTVDATPAEFAIALHRLGEEPWWIYAYTTMLESVRQGRWATR
jgi:NAD(P)H dehydrogenase (quinone)